MDKLAVNIAMDDKTVDVLANNGYHLMAFRAVESSNENGMPVVWFTTRNYAVNTRVEWGEQFGGYASESGPLAENTTLFMDCSKEMNLSQKLEVTEPLRCQVIEGQAGCLTIWNHRTEPLAIGGIGQYKGGKFSAICAFPLELGDSIVMIKPIKKVFLMFAKKAITTNTVIAQSVGPGCLINLTDKQERSVKFDFATGWSGEGTHISPQSPLGPILVLPSSTLMSQKSMAFGRKGTTGIIDCWHLRQGQVFKYKVWEDVGDLTVHSDDDSDGTVYIAKGNDAYTLNKGESKTITVSLGDEISITYTHAGCAHGNLT